MYGSDADQTRAVYKLLSNSSSLNLCLTMVSVIGNLKSSIGYCLDVCLNIKYIYILIGYGLHKNRLKPRLIKDQEVYLSHALK